MDRRKGIGGTDISAIVGMNPWKTPLDVFLDKTGQSEATPDNENMWWGREMEPVLAKRYEKETGKQIELPAVESMPCVLMPPEKSFLLGTPDAFFNVSRYEQTDFGTWVQSEGGVDFKTSGKPQEWGEPGSDEIPEQYIIQAEWYMGLTGAQWWDVAVLLMGFTRKFAIYRVKRDDELIANLTESGAKFWKDHVLANVAPPLDGSKSASDYVKRLYPNDDGPMLEPTDEHILQLIQGYHDAREMLKIREEQTANLENRLKALVGDCVGMQGDWGKITWRRSKDGTSIDWKSAFYDLTRVYETHQAEIDAVLAGYTTIKSGSRRWLPKFKED